MSAPETAKVKYVGEYDEIHVPSLGLRAKRGEAVAVPLADAAALTQQAIWEPVGKSAEPIAEAQAEAERTATPGVAPAE